jgi:environmental stress-induced protein Ves
MQLLAPADYKRTRWKNSAGITTELAIEPPTAGLEDFLWRVSIAEIEADGPFSLFPGYDRAIMLLDGRGMMLDAGANGAIPLVEPLQTRYFSGDWTVFGRLLSGPSRDFNLIVRRERMSGSLEAISCDGSWRLTCPAGGTILCHLLKGNTDIAQQGETLVSDHDLVFTAAEGRVTVVVATIRESV